MMLTGSVSMENGWWRGVRAMLVLCLVAGCGDDGDGGAGAGDDAGQDTPDASQSDGGIEAGSDAGADASSATDCSGLTYASFGKSFIDGYCASCHAASKSGSMRLGAPDEAVFDELTQVRALKAKLKEQVVLLETMPYGSTSPKPTQAERDNFGNWLDCGPD